ncbi:MAG: TolC family protein [Gammaproteobacteria bacterium]|nr:TolC family protein [Gammaproteobacteria bacterium]
MFPIPTRTWVWGLLAITLTPAQATAADGPALVPEQPLRAEQFAAAVFERNPGLASLRAAVEAAAERVPQAGALDDPMLMTKLAPSSLGRASPAYMLELSQRLPWPGKRAAREALAMRERDALAADEAALRLELAAELQSLFADYRVASEMLAVNARNHGLWQELSAVAEGLYGAGKAGRQDALATKLALKALERDRLAGRRALTGIQARLNRLLAQAPDTSLPKPEAPARPSGLPDMERLEAQALRHHPALASHASHLHAAQQELRLAELDAYPDFEVRAGYDRFWDEAPLRGTLALSINLPLGGDRAAARREAHAKTRSRQWALEDRRDALRQALAEDGAALREAVDALSLQERELLPLARENQEAALAEYRAGTGEFLRVADAQRALTETELARLAAEAALIRAWAALERDSGGAEVLAGAMEVTR